MSELSSMVDLLRRRAAEQSDDRAYVFLSEKGIEEAQLTFSSPVAPRLGRPRAGEGDGGRLP